MNVGRPGEKAPIPAEEARQGEVILRRRWQRIVFIAGLVGFVLFVLFAGPAYAGGLSGPSF